MGGCLSALCDSTGARLRSALRLWADIDTALPPQSTLETLIGKVVQCVVAHVLTGNRCIILFADRGKIYRQSACLEDCEPLSTSKSLTHLRSLVGGADRHHPRLFLEVHSIPLRHRAPAVQDGDGVAERDDMHCALFLDSHCRHSVATAMVAAGVSTTIQGTVTIPQRPHGRESLFMAMSFPQTAKAKKPRIQGGQAHPRRV